MSWFDYANYHFERNIDHDERDYSWAERSCVARIMRFDHSGENRFYVAPAPDGTWFTWGEWHGLIDNSDDSTRGAIIKEEADDAVYTFADGGANFRSREEAMAAIFRWIQRELSLEFQHVKNPVRS